MKNWLKNLKIRSKHRLMIAITILSILMMGYMAYYFHQTGTVLKIIINAERIHNVKYHSSIEDFYNYLITKDTNLIIKGMAELDSANYLAMTFGMTNKVIKEKSKEDYTDYLYNSVPEAFAYKKKNAALMTRRVNLLIKLGVDQVFESFKIATEGYKYGENIKQLMISYLEDPNPEKLRKIEEADEEMQVFFRDFAGIIYDLNEFEKRMLVGGILLSLLILGFLAIFLSSRISGSLSRPLEAMVSNFQKLSKGDLETKVLVDSNDEIGILGHTVNKMVDNLKLVAGQANIIATGDYDKNFEPRSDEDELGQAINQMTLSLRKMSQENEMESWLKTKLNELNDVMRGDQDIQALTKNIISFLSKTLNFEMGVFYMMDKENEKLVLSSSYAFTHRKGMKNEVKLGEGLVGQAAVEKEMIVLEDVPEEYFRISSGLGHRVPKYVVVCPVVYENEVMGVIELASFNNITDEIIGFLNKGLVNVGITINTSHARTEMQKLLGKTQEQAEELMTQQEELRQTNEELEEQTKALKESEQHLQQQQEELRVTNEELEERTKALERQRDDVRLKNEQLKKAREEIEMKAKDLEMASKYKSEFLANMSHELRTPLNSILVLSQILSKNKNGNLTEKQVQSANTIYSSGNSLLSLINEVLDLSKVESGKLELNPEVIDLNTFAREIEEIFKPLTSDKGLELKIDRDEKLPKMIETDPLRLQQIIRNLMSNAIKFTSEGQVEFRICKPQQNIKFYNDQLKHDETIAFCVSDTGIGIPQDKQDLIFEAFRQADGTTTRKYGGTGLGLTISKNFAHLLGGEIHLNSEENNGTTFCLVLPLNKIETSFVNEEPTPVVDEKKEILPDTDKAETVKKDIPVKQENVEEVRDDRKNITKGDKFILIIEDDPSFSQIIYDLAHERNYKCMIARNGETGLHYADYYKPDAIILDIGLPGIDGWEVMDRLKENPETRHIPVHFMSGKDKSMDAMKKGAIGFLRKPASLDDIGSAFGNIESIISKPLKKLLVVEDDETMRKSIEELIGAKDVVTTSVGTGEEAMNVLGKEAYDCMILDLGLKDISGFDLLKKLGKNGKFSNMPVIIYTGKELSREEEEQLQKYSDRIILKGVRSPERLLAETTLFLHRIESELPAEKQKMLKVLQNKGDVMKDKKVLIVDDDMRNVFALTSLLEERGMKVLVGRNGKEGIEKLKKADDIDLILMDIMMPEMNGYEAMEWIRNEKAFKDLPIIALTAKAMQGDKEKCIQAGANDYLTKPVDTDKLISLLRVWLYQ